ncbi:hypothetical protein PZA11_005544 [Diplocarpon coronariae]
MAITLLTTLELITRQLDLPTILLIIYTDLYSLYKCLIKLSITKEKRLIIDIIGLYRFYTGNRYSPYYLLSNYNHLYHFLKPLAKLIGSKVVLAL